MLNVWNKYQNVYGWNSVSVSLWLSTSVGFPSIGMDVFFFFFLYYVLLSYYVVVVVERYTWCRWRAIVIVMWSRNFSCSLLPTRRMCRWSGTTVDRRWVSCEGAWLPRISNTTPEQNIDYIIQMFARLVDWAPACMYGLVVFRFYFAFNILCVRRIWTSDGRARRVHSKVDVVTKNRKRNGYSMTTQIQYARILHGGWRFGAARKQNQ